MEYVNRELERKFIMASSFFKVIFVTGARQVGKSTMLKHIAVGTNRTYVTLDDIKVRTLAKTDPALFFQTYKLPILIDEIQKAPELFEQIKIISDNTEEAGLIWITGSQQYKVMKNIQDSLAGRVGILKLYPFTQKEILGIEHTKDFDFKIDVLMERQSKVKSNNINDVFKIIWQGMMPKVIAADDEMKKIYYGSYVDTYLMRDAIEEGGITDVVKFRKFLECCSALISEQVNYQNLAQGADITVQTAKKWLDILVGLNIIYLLQPYSNNAFKRLAKTPKLYFCDTGLASYLSMWLSADSLMMGASNGHYFENYVVMELIKTYAYGKNDANITYFRDSNKKEIDIVLEENNTIHPIEIKLSANPDEKIIKNFSVFEKTDKELGSGGIVCMIDKPLPINDKYFYIPCNII